MKKSVLAFLSAVLAFVIVSTTMTVPAQAGPLDCSLGGNFFLTNGVQWLESSTSNCAGEVTIPASVTSLGPNAFAYKNITKVTFEANSSLRTLTGLRNTQITSIEIPADTTEISSYTFAETPMKSISIPGKVYYIWANAFGADLETLIFQPRITVSNTVQNFPADSKLKSVIVNGPGRIGSLGGGFVRPGLNFVGWSESVDGPLVGFPYIVAASSVKTLYPVFTPKVVRVYNCSLGGTFETTDNVLTSSTANCAGEITIPSAVTQVNNVFNNRDITRVNFPADSSVTSFTSNALQGMDFTSIVLPPSLINIPGEAMRNSPLTSISFPGRVTGFGYDWLGPTMETITFESRISTEQYWVDGAFLRRAINLKSITFNSSFDFPNIRPGNRSLYDWSGWSLSEGGPVVSFPRTVSGSIYPNWAPKIFTATYNSNGGTPVASGTITAGVIAFPAAPTRAGYTFVGWHDNAGGSGSPVTQWMTESNPTFYAKWLINYAANYDSKGGSAVPPGSFLSGQQISEAPQAPTRPGYTFAGWSRTDGGPAISFPYAPGVASDITLFAKWAANTNAANFDSKGGSAVPARSFLTDGAISPAPAAPTRLGYTFDGWSATDGGTAVSFPYSPVATSDITLFAKWTANTYLVNLNANGGSSVPAGSFQTDGPISSALIEPFRPGYTFLGWSASDGGEVLSFPYSPGVIGNITLHAKWDANTYAVTLDTKGGLPVLAVSFRTDGAIALAPTTPIRPGYTFVGWSATDGGVAVTFPYAPGVIENITLYAVWDANTYSVNLNTTGGLALPAVSFRTDGNISLAPSIPVRVGYTFVGWALTDGGTAITFPYTPGVIEAITLYANWTRDPFKPELIAGDVISGTGIQSTLLSAAGGSWLAYPEAVVTHQWYRCSSAVAAGLQALPSASKCVKITGATASNYKVAVADAGKYLTSLVEAKNSIGTTFLTTATFRAPTLKAPTKVALPVGTGTPKASSYLTGTVGTWAGNPVPKTTVQWFRCEKATAASAKAVPGSAQCDPIRGATKVRYRLGAADKGKYVTVQITAKNTEGEAVSTAKSQRVLLEPTKVENPEISGAAGLNKSLRVNKGTWLAFPTATTTIQWYRCNRATQAGAKSFSGSSGCKAIAGATKSSYRTTAADEGKYISVLVKAVNSAGTKSVTTRSSEKIE